MTWHAALIVTLFALVAVVGGGLAATLVFRLVDATAHSRPAVARGAHARDGDGAADSASDDPDDDGSDDVEAAGEILRGGTWIGGLERIAVYAALVGGWKEAIAMVLAVKALGRYPELRNGETSAVAERFIIGTFVSVLWASGCALLALWLR